MKPSNFSIVLAACLLSPVCAVNAAEATSTNSEYLPAAKSPAEALATFETTDGLKVDLVANEPLIVDPVAIDWGADGKLWVVEMRDYPMGMDGNWKPGSRIKFLEDTNGDGIYDKATVFLDGLPFATGVTAWGKGALISSAPDIIYAEDTTGSGHADKVQKLFTGFVDNNYQARVNSLTLGLDNWIYGANGLLGGVIKGKARAVGTLSSNSDAQVQEVDIRGRDFRVNPNTGVFEPASGLTQQGRVRDDWGSWFGCDNSVPAWHYPIDDRYLRRNPFVTAPSPRVSIASGASGTGLYPISRALERFNNPGSLNHVTSGCGIAVYRDQLLGKEFYENENAFLCEPVHNLVHRMVLEPDGLTFKAVRAANEQKSEFLASSDNWFRPVQARTGPDGALWVVDMYRFVIEHPRWIPPDRLAKLDVRAGDDKGRIYRVYPAGAKLRPIPDLTRLTPAKLAASLDNSNGTERDRVHQELVYGHRASAGKTDRKTVSTLEHLAESSKLPAVRLQALCVLDGLGSLKAGMVQKALSDKHPAVRANAIRLTERFAGRASSKDKSALAEATFRLADDPELSVRYQLALSLGEWSDPGAGQALGKLAARDMDDEWMRAAILSSATNQPAEILNAVLAVEDSRSGRGELAGQLIATAAGEGNAKTLNQIASIIAPQPDAKLVEPWRFAALSSLLDSLERKGIPLSSLAVHARLDSVFDWAAKLAVYKNAKDSTRETGIRLLGRRPGSEGEDLKLLVRVLDPSNSERLQKAALNSLKRNRSEKVADLVLASWNGLSFSLRPAVIDALTSRDEWCLHLLDTLDSGRVGRNELSPEQRQRLLKSQNKQIAQAAEKIWPANSSRAEVVAKYRSVLTLSGDASKGHATWTKNCSTCHNFHGEGNNVGPNLTPLSDKSPEDFLVAILDPNAVVEPRFVAYNIETKDGRSLSGVVNAETATTLTLVQSGGVTEKILRGDIAQIRASGLSLMPEGLEQNLTPQDLADLIAFLKSGTTVSASGK